MTSTKLTSTLISQLYKSRCVLMELMKVQNYRVDDYDGFSIAEVASMHENNQFDMLLKKNNPNKKEEENQEENQEDQEEKKEEDQEDGEEENEGQEGGKTEEDQEENNNNKIYIKYTHNESTFRQLNLRHIIDDLFHSDQPILSPKDTLLVVVRDEPNESLTNEVKHIWESSDIFVILISLKRLQFNVLNHELVPTHRVLSNTEKMQIKHKYNVMSDYEFPELSRFDPVALAIGIRPGQLCEITRPSKTAISSKYYRICV